MLLPHTEMMISSNRNPGKPLFDPTGEVKMGVRKKTLRDLWFLQVHSQRWQSPFAIMTPILLAGLTDCHGLNFIEMTHRLRGQRLAIFIARSYG